MKTAEKKLQYIYLDFAKYVQLITVTIVLY